MRLALHRSIAFWFGILVMGFIGWAWLDSYQHDAWYTTRHLSGSNVAGAVSVALYQVNMGPSAGRRAIPESDRDRPVFAEFSVIGNEPQVTLPMNNWLNSSERLRLMLSGAHGAVYRIFYLPHWLIFLAAALPWLGLMLWREKRMKRANAFVGEGSL